MSVIRSLVSSVDVVVYMCYKVRDLVRENCSLREKLMTLKDYVVTTETEQELVDSDKMIRLINDQSTVTRLTADIDVLIQVQFTSM